MHCIGLHKAKKIVCVDSVVLWLKFSPFKPAAVLHPRWCAPRCSDDLHCWIDRLDLLQDRNDVLLVVGDREIREVWVRGSTIVIIGIRRAGIKF